jgi:type I restriction enzyme R subunit
LRREVEFFTEIRAAIKKHSGEELDIKPYEADMRHLINTYIHADPAMEMGSLQEMSLTELIIETGIHDAIARKLNEKGRLSNNSVAEGIINNIRKTIIREQLTDPAFYAQMSTLLEDLIQQARTDAAEYEQFLSRAEALVRRLAERQPEAGVPAVLHGNREAAVLFGNLDKMPSTTFKYPGSEQDRATLALRLDRAVRESAPAGWKGDEVRERQVLNALFPLLDRDREATLALFEIIKRQQGY